MGNGFFLGRPCALNDRYDAAMRSLFLLTLTSMALVTACGSSDTAATGGSGGKGGGGSGGATCTADCGGGGTGGVTPITGSIPGKVKRYDYVFDADAFTADTKLTLDVAKPGGDCSDFESRQVPTGDVAWNGVTATTATADMGVLHVCGEGLESGPLAVHATNTFPKKNRIRHDRTSPSKSFGAPVTICTGSS